MQTTIVQDTSPKLQDENVTESCTCNSDSIINIHKLPAPVSIIAKKTIAIIVSNGQPIAGRNNGNFDLSRIAVSDIERIEIIKDAGNLSMH